MKLVFQMQFRAVLERGSLGIEHFKANTFFIFVTQLNDKIQFKK